jgi:hypothetical protein
MSIDSAQMTVQTEASMAVLAKSLDLAATQGDQMVDLLVSAGSAVPSAPDALVAKGLAITDPALGGEIDFLA